MAYKQNFGPSRKSGKAISMCGISNIMSPLDNSYSDYEVQTTDSSAYVPEAATIDGTTGRSSGGNRLNVKKESEGIDTKLGRLEAKKQGVIDRGGNKAKETRIQGKIKRTEKRQSERAVRVEKRNERKMDRTVKREKTKNKIHNFFSSDKYDIKETPENNVSKNKNNIFSKIKESYLEDKNNISEDKTENFNSMMGYSNNLKF